MNYDYYPEDLDDFKYDAIQGAFRLMVIEAVVITALVIIFNFLT